MKIKLVSDDRKYDPKKGNETDACFDLKVKVDGERYIMPGCTEVFGTGIKVAVPEDHVMMVFPRSSTGFKLRCRMANSTGIIDAGYRDEVKIALHNFGTETIEVKDGDRLAQFLIIPRPNLEFELVEDNEDFRTGDRGGGIGSTGR